MASSTIQSPERLLGMLPEEPPVVVTPIKFASSPLAENYGSFFAMTIDNLLTPEECAKLRDSIGEGWEDVSKGTSFRECQRMLVFSHEWASALYERILPHLPDQVKALHKGDPLAEIIAGPSHLKASVGAKKSVWRIKEANERLSFLRYQPGHYFKPHCDALYARPGKDERSFLTCQIYLNDAPDALNGESTGGETRFWPNQADKRKKASETEDELRDESEIPFLDIKPKVGRALVFQQRMLWHSGQQVNQGEKFTVRLDLMFERHFEKLQ